jgi:rubrerythrin
MVRPMTESNLISAFAGESQARMRYLIYSNRAKDGGKPNIGRLFEAISYAEYIHARNHYRNVGHKGDSLTTSMAGFGSRNTVEDLQISINGETYEVDEMYPSFMEIADMQEEYAARVSFRYAWETEKIHAEFYRRAMKYAEKGIDMPLDDMCVCEICGYTVEGEAPEQCPICKARNDKFEFFT